MIENINHLHRLFGETAYQPRKPGTFCEAGMNLPQRFSVGGVEQDRNALSLFRASSQNVAVEMAVQVAVEIESKKAVLNKQRQPPL